MKRSLLLLSIVSLPMWSCIKTEEVSPIPQIEFKRIEVFLAYDPLDNLVPTCELEFSFIDGDADIGLYREDVGEDTLSWDESKYNVFLIPYQKIDTSYIAIEPNYYNPPPVDTTGQDLKPPPYYTIWHDDKLDRVGQNKTIKGTITITIYDLPQYDTIRYELFIRDRALHNSNSIITSDIGTQIEQGPSL